MSSPFKDAAAMSKEATMPPLFEEEVDSFKKKTYFENMSEVVMAAAEY